MPSRQDSRAVALLESGIAEFQRGRVEQARLLCEQALQLAPQHPDVLHLLGVIALQNRDHAAAIALLARAAAIRPDIAAYQASLGHGYVGLKQLPEALAAFERAASLEPGNPEHELGVGNCLGLLGRAAEAEAVFRRGVERHPQFALGWFNLARALEDQQRYQEACDLYQRWLPLINYENRQCGLLACKALMKEGGVIGCDFDFLVGCRGAEVPRHSH
jgi:tetratricopeptide (TPR) repeat protein